MEGTTWGARRAPPARLAARTAIAARPDPCCRLGGGWWLVAGGWWLVQVVIWWRRNRPGQ
jgi:hypothetical protein